MISINKNIQSEILMTTMEELVPKDSLFRKVDKYIDFTFIYDEVKDLYCEDNGRPSIDPVVLFKLVFIQALDGIKSMRQTCKKIKVDAEYRWFLGIPFGEDTPHFSTFSKNYERRFKDSDIFENIFINIVNQAIKYKLVDGKILYTDSTHKKANANKNKFNDEIKQIIKSSTVRTGGMISDKTISIALEEKKNIVKKSGIIEVVDTDKYEYILTYSFPCQDLSLAGRQNGMEEASGTRSALLWEVKRLLQETKELPQILVMENVPQVANENNRTEFFKWINFLESLGYSSKWQILNSKDYAVPQNRDRCFMVSWLGDYYYDFPTPKPLKKVLRDLLQPEDEIDEKYYLSEKGVNYVMRREGKYTKVLDQNSQIAQYAITAEGNENWTGNFIKCEHIADMQDCKLEVYDMYTQKSPIRKLTQKECWRIMDFDDADYENARKALNEKFYNGKDKSGSQLYKQAGNSIAVNCLCEIFNEMV